MPFLFNVGITVGAGARIAGLTTSLSLYNKFSSQIDNSLQEVTQTMLNSQNQIDSLAAVMLQNQQGLNALTKKVVFTMSPLRIFLLH